MRAGQYIVSLSLGTVAEPSALVMVQPRTVRAKPKAEERTRPDR